MSFLISQKFSYFSTKGRPIKENTLPKVLARSLTLYVGDTYNPLVNVTATDKEDGNITLTNDNIIANDVNTSKAGTYHVTYKVTDKNGASSEKTITVIVKQPTVDLNSAPTISASDVTLNVGDTFDPLAGVSATDKEDGNITLTNDNIIVNDVNTSKAGTYHVTYKVTDKNGTSSEKSITVTVQVKNTNISVNTDKAAKPSDTKQSTKTNTTKSASPKTGLPKTGDTTNVAGVFGGLVVSLGALLALLKKKRS